MNPAANPSNAAALEDQALERSWHEGQLQPLVPVLVTFAVRHRPEIAARVGTPPSPAAVLAALRQLIEEQQTLDQATEARDQRAEIEREIWYRGEHHDYDRQRITLEWIQRHAPAWRRWRVKQYLFLTERCGEQIAAGWGFAAGRN